MDNLLTTQELADYFKVSVKTVYAWRSKGMPCIRIGHRSVRHNIIDIVDWFDKNKIRDGKE